MSNSPEKTRRPVAVLICDLGITYCIENRKKMIQNEDLLKPLIPQSQITNCRRTASFSGDFDTIVRRLHGYRPVAA